MNRRVSLPLAMAVLTALVVLLFWYRDRVADAPPWRAGAAAVEITPRESMWMSGYASRDRPSEGQLSPLHAKALALQDPDGGRVLLVTLDLIGIDRALSGEIREALETRHALERADVVLSTSHTHTGPVVGSNLLPMYALSLEEEAKVEAYAEFLKAAVLEAAGKALESLEPVRLFHGEGEATFAANRRNNPEAQALALRAAGELKGPVDHRVPVLEVRGLDSQRMAVVFGYACHATVLDSFRWSGDYPGFAQAALEARYPGTIALFWAGCGADINPMPRREEKLAREYGEQLAEAVVAVLESEPNSDLRPLQDGAELATTYEEIPLAFAEVPGRDELEQRLQDENPYVVRTAEHLLERADLLDQVRSGYPYPVQTWNLGTALTWVFLGGEVVVDYALKIPERLGEGVKGPERVWVAGYCNDVMAYIPSRRVLEEGGYEGAGAMVYYGLPGPWAEDVEERILTEVSRQGQETAAAWGGVVRAPVSE